MFKPTPNPPPASCKSRVETPDSKNETAERVLDYYLNPKPADEASGKTQAAHLFMVAPDIDTETHPGDQPDGRWGTFAGGAGDGSAGGSSGGLTCRW